ncbi:MAG: response regulator [Verrucomicrobia bacterium]|nr:response regulator [Verrucomicrobiota bacterium]MBU4291095.1 response regulator [Verrucomicrobiota bacterium]MBU4429355.1 response regulator [Verrucomicrobiota bacterium]MBU4498132.1 response regulator [Verrucomicrobiota bacterium]MCG2680112.1 response regulator [Kiritimatiellia bacterium]
MAPAKKILLIEDEPEFRMALRMRLEANGYEVIEAEDGVAGLDLARNRNPDLIILDIMLPKMDGYKVARLLKFDEKHRNIPIVMLTARSQQSDRETGMSVGGDAYMTKPFKPQEMLETIAKLLAESAG